MPVLRCVCVGGGSVQRWGGLVVLGCVVVLSLWFREAKKLLADQDPNWTRWTGSTGTIHLYSMMMEISISLYIQQFNPTVAVPVFFQYLEYSVLEQCLLSIERYVAGCKDSWKISFFQPENQFSPYSIYFNFQPLNQHTHLTN